MNKSLYYAIAGYSSWGILPIFWKLLSSVPAMQVMAHRICWSLVVVTAVLWSKKDWSWMSELKHNPKQIGLVAIVSLLIGFNWYIYIWAVQANFIVEASMGYFIGPLVNVLLGFIFLAERPKVIQWFAIALAAIGVIYLTISNGRFPWISISLAVTFSIYGLLKKKTHLGALKGLWPETAILFIPALIYLTQQQFAGVGAFGHAPLHINIMLAFSGIATVVPLLCFAVAVKGLSMTSLGLLQYLSPTIQFLIGVLIYGEHTTLNQFVAFAFIWTGLVIFTFSTPRRR